MEIDIKDRLAQLEAQVAVIKDPALRQIAFGKLMDAVVQPTPRPSHAQQNENRLGGRASVKTKAKNKVSEYFSLSQVRPEIQKLTLTGIASGLPNFSECKKGWEKVLWILAAAKSNDLDGLNNHELAYILTKRLYQPTKYSTVNNVHKQVGPGLVCLDPETQRWRITPQGEIHIKGLNAKAK